ncbi:MAG: M20/M25/M40 family metallo-hydrolase [Gemmatimonadetes bacterium]|nr:M20/M25/M40 family metallo-hydrolase [Gemmatimonadota bacterium]
MRLSLILLFAVLPTATPLVAQPAPSNELEQLARDILEEMVGINTAHSEGSTLELARAMERRFLAAGFPREDVEVTQVAEREGNVLVRLRGRSQDRKPIMAMAHIDVVEADPEDWTLPPFELIEQDGTFYGRGVADDKDEAAAYAAIMIRMKQEGFTPDRDIVVALTADEEGGGHNGIAWLLANRPEWMDVAYALNEGGGGVVVDGRKIANSVQASEKKFLNFTVEATNPGGHSSRPRPDNAIYELSKALTRIGEYRFPVNLNEVTTAFFTRSADFQDDPRMADAMGRLVADQADQDAVRTLEFDSRYNAMMRTTCVATLLEGGHASNALPQRATANVNCRILPDESPEDVLAQLRRAVGDAEGVVVTMDGNATNSPPSPLTPEVLAPVDALTEEMWPGVPVVPTMSTGATDALYLRNAGIPVYGVSGMFFGDSFAHGMNERIPVQAFYEGVAFLDRLVRTLSSRSVS